MTNSTLKTYTVDYPPNHFNCRSSVITLTAEEARWSARVKALLPASVECVGLRPVEIPAQNRPAG